MRTRLAVVDGDRCVGCQVCMFACVRRTGAGGLSNARIHVRSDGGIERGFVVIVCRACPEPQCAKVCPADALECCEGGGVTLRTEKCLGCGLCLQACPFGAVFWDEEAHKPVICVYCGLCAQWCPHGVLELEKTVPS